ncbi:unnamed protein product [Mytilus edulis]|uniref:Uncharacterized protein n=1 Tax=Mytilus edulis TaxID=6550 RepID=A0A8S3UAZ8_MYTED|nr:unnamed protein product [Mytilus edulis]
MTPFEAVFGQKANDGICVGSQETDEFIDEENIEYMIEGEGDVMTDGQTENETDSQKENETDSQTENETDSQTEAETDSQTDAETDSQPDAETDLQIETVQPARKRRRTETSEISTEKYDGTDYRPTQDEIMAVDDFMILNDIITDPPEDNNCTIAMDDEQMTSHDRIRKILDKNYKKSVENTMRKYNKKVSKTNAKIEKGSFVTVRIPVVDRASGDLPRLLCRVDDIIGKDASLYKLSCEFGILNSCYDMGDIELLTRKIETEHWSTNGISLHAAAKQASFSLATQKW